jgi:cell division protein FtsQ
MNRRIWFLLAWALSLVLLLIILVQTGRRHDRKVCREVRITIHQAGEDDFISRRDIENYMKQTGDSIRGKRLEQLNLHFLESLISRNPYVKNAHVYSTIDAVVHIEVRQRKPIVRVQNLGADPFYISEDGKLMPLNPGRPARVLVASGYFSYDIHDPYYQQLDLSRINPAQKTDSLINRSSLYSIYRVASRISSDAFLQAQITQIVCDRQGMISLIPLVGSHTVILGNDDDLEEKFSKLEVFYRQGLSVAGWDTYDTINLEYKNQVVCSPK